MLHIHLQPSHPLAEHINTPLRTDTIDILHQCPVEEMDIPLILANNLIHARQIVMVDIGMSPPLHLRILNHNISQIEIVADRQA